MQRRVTYSIGNWVLFPKNYAFTAGTACPKKAILTSGVSWGIRKPVGHELNPMFHTGLGTLPNYVEKFIMKKYYLWQEYQKGRKDTNESTL